MSPKTDSYNPDNHNPYITGKKVMLVTLSFPVMQNLASAYLDCYLARRSLSETVKLNGVNPHAWLKAIVDWSLVDVRECARTMEEKRRRGEPLDALVPDAFVAAAAVSCRLAVVTRNTGKFRNTGVETVNPWTAEPR